MNNNRLSTNSEATESVVISITFTSSEIERILSGSSNYEKQEDGKILIKSSNKYSF